MKRVLIATGGGDCPGLNAVIRAIVKRASQEKDWEVLGSIQGFNGILWEPQEVIRLDRKTVEGIHYRGGTILETTNKGGPFNWPFRLPDGTWATADRSDEMIRRLSYMGVDAVINIGGDGSQHYSQKLFEKGLNIVGVPKTIDNDLSCTDVTFGFQTAVEVATEAVDKLVTTAQSHNRVFIIEVMGRDAGWIALHSAIAGGADVCLIPEVPYDIRKVAEAIEKRFVHDRGFCIIVIAEGAKPKGGDVIGEINNEIGAHHIRLYGASIRLREELKAIGCTREIRETILGHLQRGGIPVSYDRVLASRYGVKAFELVKEGKFGQMVSYRHPDVVQVPIAEAISRPNFVTLDSDILESARGLDICFGD
ncbi:MAG: ATP-dependent 6-phosphofructokinase [Bacteroidales bacterium]|jgi:6-phosphofructokinase 1|nr:ATP-dependent 6-phosphofructokinase [Bacteroidales bacterium]